MLEEQKKKFCSGSDKMGNASGHQCKGKISGSEKNVNEKNTYDISPIKRVTKRFLEVSRIVVQNNSKEVCCTSKVAFFR